MHFQYTHLVLVCLFVCFFVCSLYLSVNVFSTKVLTGDTIFTSPTGENTTILLVVLRPTRGPAACSAKGVPSFLSYFKTLSTGPAPGIELAASLPRRHSSACVTRSFVGKERVTHAEECLRGRLTRGILLCSEALYRLS